MASLKLSLRWQGGRAGHNYSFAIPRDKGEVRGEVDDSATAPLYAVQHCVVDTYSGEVVLAPTNDEDRAEDLAERLNRRDVRPGAGEHPPPHGGAPDRSCR